VVFNNNDTVHENQIFIPSLNCVIDFDSAGFVPPEQDSVLRTPACRQAGFRVRGERRSGTPHCGINSAELNEVKINIECL